MHSSLHFAFPPSDHTTASTNTLQGAPGSGCTKDCQKCGVCGDGVVDPGEECDKGPLNGQWNSGCSANCTCVGICGDGHVDPDAQPTAPVLPSAVRLTPTSSHYVNTNSFTGDGHVDPGEQCDLGPLNGQWNSGCSANCTCTPVCGNGIVEEGESCDLGSQNGVFNSGCSKNCTCTPVCGNGIKE